MVSKADNSHFWCKGLSLFIIVLHVKSPQTHDPLPHRFRWTACDPQFPLTQQSPKEGLLIDYSLPKKRVPPILLQIPEKYENRTVRWFIRICQELLFIWCVVQFSFRDRLTSKYKLNHTHKIHSKRYYQKSKICIYIYISWLSVPLKSSQGDAFHSMRY